MSQSLAVWLVIVAAVVAANLPFMNGRLLACVALPRPKNLAMRACELVVLYGLVGALGWGLEQHLGQASVQGWEFYAVTGALFVTLAFPGFVWRYLRRGS